MDSAKLSIVQLEKYFGSLHVLKGLTCSVNSGNIVVLLGGSGSGKSTLLRCINLLEVPDGGTVSLDGIPIDYSADKNTAIKVMNKLRQKIGMVFQQFNLWPHLTILQNLTIAPICILKQSKTDAIYKAEQLLVKVGLLDKKDYYPLQLSGGQQQRVAIARSLMMEPEIMLFDEPTSALDPEMTNEVLKIIKKLAQDGMTMVIATHEISFAKEVATHALFLEHGTIHEEGIAREILTNPRTLRLQQFLNPTHY